MKNGPLTLPTPFANTCRSSRYRQSSSAPSKENMIVLQSLRKAVAEALDRKKRRGQYAVVWQDGQPTIIGDDKLETTRQPD